MVEAGVFDKPNHKRDKKELYASLGIYHSMAYYVAEKLHLDPNTILDNWSAPELVVAFGQYSNQQATKHFEEYKQLDAKQKAKYGEQPRKYIVQFYRNLDEYFDLNDS